MIRIIKFQIIFKQPFSQVPYSKGIISISDVQSYTEGYLEVIRHFFRNFYVLYLFEKLS